MSAKAVCGGEFEWNGESTEVRMRRRDDGPSSGVLAVPPESADDRRTMELLGRVTGAVVHDLNNVLAIVSVCCEEARAALPAGHRAATALDELMLASSHGANLTRELLRAVRGRPAVAAETTALNTVVVEAARLMKRLAGPDVTVTCELDPTNDEFEVGRDRWMSVLVNLAVNAIQAMPNGGRLVFRTDREPSEPNGAPRPRLFVEDTGVGFALELATKMFEPFTTTKADGTGIGLDTVKRYVEECGATISVQSRPSHGTVFCVCFGEDD